MLRQFGDEEGSLSIRLQSFKLYPNPLYSCNLFVSVSKEDIIYVGSDFENSFKLGAEKNKKNNNLDLFPERWAEVLLHLILMIEAYSVPLGQQLHLFQWKIEKPAKNRSQTFFSDKKKCEPTKFFAMFTTSIPNRRQT